MFTAVIENESDFAEAWQRATMIISIGCRRGVEKGTDEGAAEARARHTFKNQSGRLEKSIEGKFTEASPDVYKGVIETKVKYGKFVENGTQPHVIEPRKARILHWEEPQGDHHFSRVVHHPGTRPQPFMGIAYTKCEAVLIREIELGVAQAQAFLDR